MPSPFRRRLEALLTKSVAVASSCAGGLSTEKVQIPPSKLQIAALEALILAFFGLMGLEIAHMLLFGEVNQAVLTWITFIAGTIAGVFMGARG